MKKYLYFVILLACISCKESSRQNIKSLSEKYTELKGVTLTCDSVLLSPRIVSFFNNNIVTLRYSGEYIFTVYHVDNNQIKEIGSFGKIGIGPNEFSGIVSCYFDQVHNSFYIFNINDINVESYQIDLSYVANLFNVNTWKKIPVPSFEKTYWRSFTPVSDSLLIALGGNIDKMNLLSIIDLKTKSMKELAIPFPQDGIDVAPLTKRFVYNSGELLKRPSANQFLYYCKNWGNYAEIITLEDGKPVHRKIISEDYPIYRTAANGIDSQSDKGTLMGMISYVTNKYIYIMPDFRNKEEYLNNNKNKNYPNDHLDMMYIFDWEGQFVKLYKLSKPIGCFVVTPDDSFILGSCDDFKSGDLSIEKFQLR